MSHFYQTLLQVLKDDTRFFSKDNPPVLLRNTCYNAAMQMDGALLKNLLSNEETRKHFFTEVDGALVFDKVAFGWVINNRQFLPDSYTRYKNKIGLVNAKDEYISQTQDVELVFPYKDCVLEGGQTKDDQKRNEIFYNQTLSPDEVDRLLYPKVFTNAKKITKDGTTPVTQFNQNDNLIIKGNNLLALSSLLPRYGGKIKCIYIDPPYFFKELTATDTFKYNSNFHLSTWLVFLKDRLKQAQKLLMSGGTIWIHISEDGMHYLKLLADDIFGADHFIGTIPRRTRSGKSDVPFNLSQDFDWILVYTNVSDTNAVLGRTLERKYYETDDFPNEPWRISDLTSQQPSSKRPNSFFTMIDPKTKKEYPASEKRTWAITKDTFEYYYNRGAIIFPDDYDFLNITKPYMRKFKSEDDSNGKLSAVISDFLIQDFLKVLLSQSKNTDGNTQIDEMFGRNEFDYAKPEKLINAILEVATEENDIVLDFFAGSGTTLAVAHKMNRQYIGIEQMDYIEPVTIERLKKVIDGEQGGISKEVGWTGGGSFIYCELAQLNQTYANRIQTATTDSELITVWNEMCNTGFISTQIKPQDVDTNAKDFTELNSTDKQKILMELLDKNMLYVSHCDMDDSEYAITQTDKDFTNSFYKGE